MAAAYRAHLMVRCVQKSRAPVGVDALDIRSHWCSATQPCTCTRPLAPPLLGDRQSWKPISSIFTFSCLSLLLFPVSVQAREADIRSRFLYADDPRATAILEYQLHNAPTTDYTVEGQLNVIYDDERHIRPYFLNPDNGRRVVQYYSPWCG